MKNKVILLCLALLLSSCSVMNTVFHKDHQQKLKPPNSNYFFFDYIESLDSDDYYVKLDSIKNGLSEDYFTLRMAYTKTKNYSPYGNSPAILSVPALIDSMMYEKALEIVNEYQKTNWVDIVSHYYCAYAYSQLQDTTMENYHYKIYDGLLNSIYQSGDGKTPETAFIVISTKEEYSLLNWFGLQSRGQSLTHDDDYPFDMIKAYDPRQDEAFEIYFNIEIPFTALDNALGF